MAAHRRSRKRSAGGHTARTAAAIALAGAATATGFDGPALAEPQATPQRIKAEVDGALPGGGGRHREVQRREGEGGVGPAAAARSARRDGPQDRAARRSAGRPGVGRGGAVPGRRHRPRPASSSCPRTRTGIWTAPPSPNAWAAASRRRWAACADNSGRSSSCAAAARVEVEALTSRRAEMKRHKRTITGKLTAARRLLARLPPEQRDAGADHASRSPAGPPETV